MYIKTNEFMSKFRPCLYTINGNNAGRVFRTKGDLNIVFF